MEKLGLRSSYGWTFDFAQSGRAKMATDGTPRKRANKKSSKSDQIALDESRASSVDPAGDEKTVAAKFASKLHSPTKYSSASKNTEVFYKFWLILVSFLAFATRAAMIHHPGEVVFDEVHFGKFASFYLRNEYYFDVHPPLGKMLIALIAWLVGYDGHFLFDKIGDNYSDNNVPYIALRLWCCLCGAAIVPFAYLTMKEMGVSILGCVFGSLLLVFDTALVTQSRMILLDSMLMLFCIMSIYFWVKFHASRHHPFSLEWWYWLFMTGVGLALVSSVKMVGLFTVATIGIATLVDLWELMDIRRGHSLKYVGKHFTARALCLIVLPLILYLVPFYLHFKILNQSGPGDNFMSLEFQAGLKGNTKTTGATDIPYFSTITVQHHATEVFMHSHDEFYPLRYADGRISSKGQQVVGISKPDENSVWEILPVDESLYPDSFELTDDETSEGIRWLRHQSLVRLRHVGTDSYLLTHDVASPLTKTNMEITTVKDDVAIRRYNETIWRIQLFDAHQGDKTVIKSKKHLIFFTSVVHNVALHTFKQPLPDWGFKMQEINGNKKVLENSNRWNIINVTHPSIKVKTVEELKTEKKKELSFLRKFLELQGLMFHHNAQLTKSHPYSSAPITWPFVVRGISFWENADGLKQIYLLGNPFAWWLSVFGLAFYAVMWVIDRLILHRGQDDMGVAARNWWDRAVGFLTLCWFMHWGPFFLMGRMLFLHHYLPSYIFSAMTTATLLDFIFRDFARPLFRIPARTPMKIWRGSVPMAYYIFALGFIAILVYGFYYFMPLCYGLGFPDKATLRTRKWISSWDFQYS